MPMTDNQLKAIHDNSGTLLISAGAGSGKTTVLTSRLIERLCDANVGHDISEYLVVTFTRAATKELKERLRKKLGEEVKNNPHNKYVLKQLTRIGLAKICTIHSFCFDLVRTNFQMLGLPSKLRIGDDAETTILCRTLLEGILEDRYSSSSDDSAFIKLAVLLSSDRSDKAIADILFNLYNSLRCLPSPFEFLDKSIENYNEVATKEDFLDTAFGKLCVEAIGVTLKKCITMYGQLIAEMGMDSDFAKTVASCEKELELMESAENSLSGGYENVLSAISLVTKQRVLMPRGYPDKDYTEKLKKRRDEVWDDIVKIKKKFFTASQESLKYVAQECAELLTETKNILLELDKKYSERKCEKGIIDYSDLEHKALELLCDTTKSPPQPTEFARKYADGLAEIYIDEYQDVNPLQDMIFRCISKKDEKTGEECNRFLVGDLKQSIYRFRGARAEIFADYIKRLPLLDTEEAKSTTAHKLYLSDNFRCAENIISFTNDVFSKLMSSYDEGDALICSKIEENKITAPCEMAIIEKIGPDEDESEEELSAEATFVANKIGEIVRNPSYLKENGEMYEYSDIAILVRNANAMAKAYRRVFEIAGIPIESDTPEDFFEKTEVLLALCLFNTVDNPERDIYTAGLMRSPLYNFTDEELVEMRMRNRNSSFWGCVCAYANEYGGSPLGQKVSSFIEKINGYRALSRGLPTDMLILRLYDDTGLMNIVSAEDQENGGGKNSEKGKSLTALYELARGFEKTSYRGLSSYLAYINDKAKANTDVRGNSGENAVKLMSTHRSKGLEFPVCFVTELGKSFNMEDTRKTFVKSDDFGIGMKLKNLKGNKYFPTDNGHVTIDTPFRNAVSFAELKGIAEEEKRLLYVAMTRAKERLYLTASIKDIGKTLDRIDAARASSVDAVLSGAKSNIISLLCVCPDNVFADLWRGKGENECDRSGFVAGYIVSPEKATNITKVTHREKLALAEHKPSEELIKRYADEIKKSAEYQYPYADSVSKLPAKLTVSQLKVGLLDDTEQTPKVKEKPMFMTEQSKTVTGTEKGTALHMFMQFANYKTCEQGEIVQEADRLCNMHFITKRQREILDLDKIAGFFGSKLYCDEIKNSRRVFRERRFNLSLPAKQLFQGKQDMPEEKLLVQGVIDCFWLNDDDTYTLLDFKTDAVALENGEQILLSRHAEQLKLYRLAVKEMTGGEIKKSLIYSFALGREIEVQA